MCSVCRDRMLDAGIPTFVVDAVYPVEKPVNTSVPVEDSDYFKRVEAMKIAATLNNANAGELIKRADGIYRWLTRGEKVDTN